MNKALDEPGVAWLVALQDAHKWLSVNPKRSTFENRDWILVSTPDEALKFADRESAETFRSWADATIITPAELTVEDHSWE